MSDGKQIHGHKSEKCWKSIYDYNDSSMPLNYSRQIRNTSTRKAQKDTMLIRKRNEKEFNYWELRRSPNPPRLQYSMFWKGKSLRQFSRNRTIALSQNGKIAVEAPSWFCSILTKKAKKCPVTNSGRAQSAIFERWLNAEQDSSLKRRKKEKKEACQKGTTINRNTRYGIWLDFRGRINPNVE